MAEEDAFLVDDVEGGLCVENTNAIIDGRFNSGSNKDKGKLRNYEIHLNPSKWQRIIQDFKHTLKHGKDDLSLVQLGSHLRIEESLRAQDSDKGKGKEVVGPSMNMTEEGKNKNNKQNKGKNMVSKNTVVVRVPTRTLSWNVGSVVRLVTSRGIAVVVIRRTQMLVVREKGLRTIPKTKVDAIAWLMISLLQLMFVKIVAGLRHMNRWKMDLGIVIVVIRRTKMLVVLEKGLRTIPKTKVDAIAWWIDSGATTHVCKDRCWLKIYELVEDRSVLYMGDDHSAPIHGKRSVVLEFSLGKSITLFNVLKTLGEKGIDCIFIGYAEHSKAYRFYVIKPNDLVSINSVIESRDAIFNENCFSSLHRPKDIIPNLDESQSDDHSDDVPTEIPEPRKGCKCIFKRKMKFDGTIDKFKAQLVIQGFRQKEGIDYFDTYVPVACITTIILLLALAAIHNLVIHQMDVKSTFLNGDLDEEVYMKQPEVDKTKKFLSSKFSMKDIGEADVNLGIKIKRENKKIVITQSHYIKKILKKFNREDFSPVSTSMDPVEKLKLNTGKPMDQLEYSRAIGCLMHVMTSTRPDIAYAVGRLSRFTSNPSRQHWQAITKVLKYLKCTMNYGLSYAGYPSMLEAYSDATWINHVEDSSFTSGWVYLLGGGVI
nr:zinc finger, CCHC-type [Tanacetum cinerariifolium]